MSSRCRRGRASRALHPLDGTQPQRQLLTCCSRTFCHRCKAGKSCRCGGSTKASVQATWCKQDLTAFIPATKSVIDSRSGPKSGAITRSHRHSTTKDYKAAMEPLQASSKPPGANTHVLREVWALAAAALAAQAVTVALTKLVTAVPLLTAMLATLAFSCAWVGLSPSASIKAALLRTSLRAHLYVAGLDGGGGLARR